MPLIDLVQYETQCFYFTRARFRILSVKGNFENRNVSDFKRKLFWRQIPSTKQCKCRSEWPRGLRRGTSAARLLGLCARIPSEAWTCVSCECCVLSGRCICDGLITCPEESYRLWWVWVWLWVLDNEEVLVLWGLLGFGKEKDYKCSVLLNFMLFIPCSLDKQLETPN